MFLLIPLQTLLSDQRKNRVNVKQSRLEQDLKSIQKHLKQFQNILPFLEKENISTFLKSHDDFLLRPLYIKSFHHFAMKNKVNGKLNTNNTNLQKIVIRMISKKEIETMEEKMEIYNKKNGTFTGCSSFVLLVSFISKTHFETS